MNQVQAAITGLPETDLKPASSVDEAGWAAIGLVIAATVFFSASDIASKALVETLPATQVVWLRYVVFAMIAVPAALLAFGRHAFATPLPRLQAARAAAVVGSSALFVGGLPYMGVPEATAINFISPVAVMALSIFMLGEKVGYRRWSAAAVAFAGVLIVVQPGSDTFTPAAAFPIGAALCWAMASVLARMMAKERPQVTLAWTALAGVVLLAPFLSFAWKAMTAREIALVMVAGILSAAGNWLVLLALRMAPASALAPFFYVQMVSAGALSWAILGMPPSQAAAIGSTVIGISGIYLANRTRVRQKEAACAKGVSAATSGN